MRADRWLYAPCDHTLSLCDVVHTGWCHRGDHTDQWQPAFLSGYYWVWGHEVHSLCTVPPPPHHVTEKRRHYKRALIRSKLSCEWIVVLCASSFIGDPWTQMTVCSSPFSSKFNGPRDATAYTLMMMMMKAFSPPPLCFHILQSEWVKCKHLSVNWEQGTFYNEKYTWLYHEMSMCTLMQIVVIFQSEKQLTSANKLK